MSNKEEKSLHTFNSVYNAENSAIFRFCLLRVSDREQALDITQETFTRYWKSLLEGKEMTNVRAFLFTVAHRLIIDWYRKKKSLSLEDVTTDPETGEMMVPSDQTYEDIELESEGRFLLKEIDKLSQNNRQAVYLRYVEGLSPPEIGEVLGITADAASVRVSRGLDELRKNTGYEKKAK